MVRCYCTSFLITPPVVYEHALPGTPFPYRKREFFPRPALFISPAPPFLGPFLFHRFLSARVSLSTSRSLSYFPRFSRDISFSALFFSCAFPSSPAASFHRFPPSLSFLHPLLLAILSAPSLLPLLACAFLSATLPPFATTFLSFYPRVSLPVCACLTLLFVLLPLFFLSLAARRASTL